MNDTKKPILLYVDDETKALEYFAEEFSNEYNVITATSADGGWEQVKKYGDQISILLSDQRMPGKEGVDLLTQVRQHYPKIMRILTTAYADMDAIIGAVNKGFIYGYVTKPWKDIDNLRFILKKALDYSNLTKERDALLKEKLSALTRIIIMDRVKSLSIMATGFSKTINNALSAVDAFTQCMLEELKKGLHFDRAINNSFLNLGLQADIDLKIVKSVLENFIYSTEVAALPFKKDTVQLATCIQSSIDTLSSQYKESRKNIELISVVSNIPSIHGDLAMIERSLHILLEAVVKLSKANASILVTVKPCDDVWHTKGVQVLIQVKDEEWNEEHLKRLFTIFGENEDLDLSLDLLSAFFMIHHHNGDIIIHTKAYSGFEVLLPIDPSQAKRPPIEGNTMEKVHYYFDEMDLQEAM